MLSQRILETTTLLNENEKNNLKLAGAILAYQDMLNINFEETQ